MISPSLRKVIVLLLLCINSTYAFAQSQENPVIDHGILDVRKWDFNVHKIALVGHWKFYENELLVNPSKPAPLIYFPEVLSQVGHPNIDVATYSATIHLASQTGKLAFEIPQLYSSYILFVDGKRIAENGVPGNSEQTTTPQWKPQVVAFDHTSDSIRVTLQLANFYHYNTGAKQPIYLGESSMLEEHDRIATRSNLAECAVLLVLGISFFIIYYVRQEKKKITLYFSLLCISWAIRSVFSNNYLITDYVPDFNWAWMVKIEYITLFSMLIWTVLFFSRLFPKESNKLIKYIFVIGNCTFILAAILLPPAFFTKWIMLYLLVAALVLVHGAVVTIRALINERAGVWYLVFSLVLGLVIFGYDIFVFEGFFQYYNAPLFSIGYVIIFVLMGIALFYHLRIFKPDGSTELKFDDLYGSEEVKAKL